MAADPLTSAVSDRICAHMNDDHAEAVVAYRAITAVLRTPAKPAC